MSAINPEPAKPAQPIKPTIESLQAELEKARRSKKYWENRVKDHERRAQWAREEENWKEARKAHELGTDEFSEMMREQYKQQAKAAAKAYGLQAPMPLEIWRRLVQLTHPDKHGGSAAAVEATRWLLENRG